MPFLFKNKETQKWLSFDKNSSTYNNRSITLTECKECDDNTVPADMPDSVSDEYLIKQNENCIFPDSTNSLISENCNNSDSDVYILKKLNDSFLEQSLPNALKVSIGFSDNSTAMVNGSPHNWGKELTTATHYYKSDESKENSEIYTIIKDPQLYEGNNALANPKYRDFITKNLEIRCKLFHVIEEYNSSKQLVAKTIYRLKYMNKSNIGDLTDPYVDGILMFIESNENELSNSSSSPQTNDIVVSYFDKSNYTEDNLSETNSYNFSRAYIGAIVSEGDSATIYGYINTSEYGGGVIIKKNSPNKTVFRVVPNDGVFNRMVKYSYPPQETSRSGALDVNMSSFLNPKKKMIVSSNNKVISKNFRDESQQSNTIFNIVPVSESFSVMEGFATDSIGDKIATLNNMLQSSTSFENIIVYIKSVLSYMYENNGSDAYNHIVAKYENDLKNIMYCFDYANRLYENLSRLHKNFTENYLKIGLNNVYGNATNSETMIFADDLADEVVDQLNKLSTEIAATKDGFQEVYNLSLIEVNADILFFLVNIFKYFQNNYNNIKKHVDVFFDYNYAKVHIDYCKTKDFLRQINFDSNESFNYDNLIILSTGTLKQRIEYGESYKNKSKTFFDIDFGEIYNQLFVDATSGSRPFVNTRISKILHKRQQITSQFITANNGQNGVMHYYHNLLISQKEYYRRFLEIKNQNNNIIYFETSLPNTSTPITIFEHWNTYGKTLQFDDSYFFAIMNYYSDLATSSSNDSGRQAEIFLSLFKNLRYYKDTGTLIPTLDYSDIKNDNLYKYYENNHFINKKSEPNIISTFMDKYNTMANVIEANSGSHGGVISINEESLKISEPFKNIEGFVDIKSASVYHPSKPSIIAAPSKTDYDISVFADAFRYPDLDEPNNSTSTLGDYLQNKFSGGNYVPKNATCVDPDGTTTYPNIVMRYSCGQSGENYYDSGINDFFSLSACKSSKFTFEKRVVLEYKDDNSTNTCYVRLRMNNNKNSTYKMSGVVSVPRISNLVTFDYSKGVSNGVQELTTKYEGPAGDDNTMDYLEDIGNDEPDDSSYVLYSNPPYFRLYIKGKKLKLDYKLALGKKIDDRSTDMKGNLDPTVELSQRTKVVHLYKNGKNVGDKVNKSLYIDSAGVSHNITSGNLDTTTNTINSKYYEYDNYCYSRVITDNADANIIAKFEPDGATKTETNLNADMLKDVYPSLGSNCAGSDSAGTLKLQKNAFNSDYGACMTNPEDVSMTNIVYYDTKLAQNPSNDFSDAKCDKKHVFSGAVEQFKADRNTFRDIFADMIEKFNELNENELEMLNGTQESIENLKETISEYNELYEKATENKGKKTIIDAQTDDAKIVLKQSQHGMALMGIGAIGATMLMFNYMKK